MTSPNSFAAANASRQADPIKEHFEASDRERAFENGGYVLTKPQLHPVALHGILKEIVEVACANTEAVPSSVAVNVLARFAATIGRTARIQIGDQTRFLNFNALIVGPTSKGRKGTSADMPAQLFRIAEQLNGLYTPALPELTSLSTGEGLIHRVHDPRFDDETGKCIDKGVSDKRLLCDISEFGVVLAVAARKEATISMVLRDAFDGKVLTTPTKTSFNRATGAHICVLGSITEDELVKMLSQTDIMNGLANRFAMFYASRDKIVPDPKPTPPERMNYFAKQIHEAALRAMYHQGAIEMNDEAKEFWDWTYRDLNEQTRDPKVAKLLAREELYTRILSALLALLNGEVIITQAHLEAAGYWRTYWEETAMFVFSTDAKQEYTHVMKLIMDRIVEVVGSLGGRHVQHNAVVKKLTNNYAKNSAVKPDHVKEAVKLLQRESPPRIIVETTTNDGAGRPANVYTIAAFRK